MTDRELMQTALEALEFYVGEDEFDTSLVDALRERLAHCDRCGKKLGGEGDIHTCTPRPEQEPVAIALNTGTKQGVKWLKNVEHGESLYTTPPAAQRTEQEWFSEVMGGALFDFQEATGCDTAEEFKAQRSWVGLTEREIELLDAMIEAQLYHALQCDSIPNRVMAEKQKGWDMERVALLRKLKEGNT